MGLHETQKLLHSEGDVSTRQKEATTEWEDICKQYIQ